MLVRHDAGSVRPVSIGNGQPIPGDVKGFIKAYFLPRRLQLLVVSAYSALNTLFDVLPEILIGFAIDTVVNRENSFLASMGISDVTHQMVLLALVTFVVWALESLFQYLYIRGWRGFAQDVQHAARLDLYKHLQSLRMDVIEEQSKANLANVATEDINQFERFLNDGIHSVISLVLSFVFVAGTFLYFSPAIAAAAMLPIPAIIWLSVRYKRRIEAEYVAVRESAGELSSVLNNNLLGIATIRTSGRESYESGRLEWYSNQYGLKNRSCIRLSAGYVPALRMLIVTGFIGVLLLGGVMALKGEIPIGAYGTLVFLTQRLLWPMASLGGVVESYQRMLASVHRIVNTYGLEVVAVSDGNAQHGVTARGEIDFENVDFGYRGQDNLLTGLNLNIAAGSTVAITGRSGAGKSTLLKLMLGFYQPDSGRIAIDGINVSEISDLHHGWISYVGQDPFLFRGTLLENLRYGNFIATIEEIENVCRHVGIYEFIASLPDKFETNVGEGGSKISGGQRQRIELCRALLRPTKILLLDEFTSALDRESEAEVHRAVKLLAHGRTVVVVTHNIQHRAIFDKVIHVSGAGAEHDAEVLTVLA